MLKNSKASTTASQQHEFNTFWFLSIKKEQNIFCILIDIRLGTKIMNEISEILAFMFINNKEISLYDWTTRKALTLKYMTIWQFSLFFRICIVLKFG